MQKMRNQASISSEGVEMSENSSKIFDGSLIIALFIIVALAGFVSDGLIGAILAPIISFGFAIIIWKTIKFFCLREL